MRGTDVFNVKIIVDNDNDILKVTGSDEKYLLYCEFGQVRGLLNIISMIIDEELPAYKKYTENIGEMTIGCDLKYQDLILKD